MLQDRVLSVQQTAHVRERRGREVGRAAEMLWMWNQAAAACRSTSMPPWRGENVVVHAAVALKPSLSRVPDMAPVITTSSTIAPPRRPS